MSAMTPSRETTDSKLLQAAFPTTFSLQKCRQMEKRGQMEMIGIAIVVVLIVLGATLFLTLSIKPPSGTHAAFAQKQAAQNMVDAIVRTATLCHGLDFAAVLGDCSKNGEDGLTCEDGRRSCDYARGEIANILDRVLGVRKVQYRFTAEKDVGGKAFEDIMTPGCTKALIDNGAVTVETPGIQPIPLYPGTLTITLQICMPVR